MLEAMRTYSLGPAALVIALCVVPLLSACSPPSALDIRYKAEGGVSTDTVVDVDAFAGGDARNALDAAVVDAPGEGHDVGMDAVDAAMAGDLAGANDAVIVLDSGDGVDGRDKGTVLLVVQPGSAELVAIAYEGSDPPAASRLSAFRVTNNGDATTGSLHTALVPAPSQFQIVDDACDGRALLPGASCDVGVVFAPFIRTVKVSSLVISDALSSTSVAASLTGTFANASCLRVTPSDPNLGSVVPGETGREVSITLENWCTEWDAGSVYVSLYGTDSDFVRVSSNGCVSLKGRSSCVIGLQLAPPAGTSSTFIQAWLTLGGSNGGVQLAILLGAVLGPSDPVDSNSSSVSFGTVIVGQAARRIVTIQNYGSIALDPLTVELRGTGATQLSVLSSNCGLALEAGSTCQVQLQYLPVDATGVTAVLAVNAGSYSLAIPVVGAAQAAPVDAGTTLDDAPGDIGGLD